MIEIEDKSLQSPPRTQLQSVEQLYLLSKKRQAQRAKYAKRFPQRQHKFTKKINVDSGSQTITTQDGALPQEPVAVAVPPSPLPTPVDNDNFKTPEKKTINQEIKVNSTAATVSLSKSILLPRTNFIQKPIPRRDRFSRRLYYYNTEVNLNQLGHRQRTI